MGVDNLRGVEAIYRIIEILKSELSSNPFCNNVTVGMLTEIDLQKMSIFPMAHISLENVTHNDNSLSFRITIFNLDVVEISKDQQLNDIYGNDNLLYIWQNQLYVINKLVNKIKSSMTYYDGWEINNNPQSDFINKEFENMLAGYQTTIELTVPNDMSKC